MTSLQNNFLDFLGLFTQPPDCPYLPFLTLWGTFRAHRPRPQNLAQKFFFRAQIALAYPSSPCGALSGPTDLAPKIWRRSSSSVPRLPLPTLPHPVGHFQGPQTSPAPVAVLSLHTKPPPHFLSFPRPFLYCHSRESANGIHRSFWE